MSCWLILEKSFETRVAQGIDVYPDLTGEEYGYDSLVPNHKNVHEGDFVVIRKEDEIVGTGIIGQISESEGIKTHRRCPICSTTDIRVRKTMSPKWKCGRCSHEFAEPNESNSKVKMYGAKIENFNRLDNPPSVEDVKRCSLEGKGTGSQLSIMRLDSEKLRQSLAIDWPDSSNNGKSPRANGQGYGLSVEQRKLVEERSMRIATELYVGNGWNVKDTSLTCPYDLLAEKRNEKRFVEVKGTTGDGSSVILTNGEVEHARSHPGESAIVVISAIKVTRQGDEWVASGGSISKHLDSWEIDEALLQPTEYRYKFN